MCIYVLAHDAASPWAERSKQITTITSDWSLILHHGLLFIYHGKCKEHFTHPILPDVLIYLTVFLLFPLHRSLSIYIFFFCSVMITFCPSATSWTRYWFMCFFSLLYLIVYSTLVLIWLSTYAVLFFFVVFFVIDVDDKRPICHSHTVLQKQTSETLSSLETVAPQNAAKSIRRLPDLSDDTLMNWTELLCSNRSPFNKVQKRLQPMWTSLTLILFKWHLYFFVMCKFGTCFFFFFLLCFFAGCTLDILA